MTNFLLLLAQSLFLLSCSVDFDETDEEWRLMKDTVVVVSNCGLDAVNGEYRHVEETDTIGYWLKSPGDFMIRRRVVVEPSNTCQFMLAVCTPESMADIDKGALIAVFAPSSCIVPPTTQSQRRVVGGGWLQPVKSGEELWVIDEQHLPVPSYATRRLSEESGTGRGK